MTIQPWTLRRSLTGRLFPSIPDRFGSSPQHRKIIVIFSDDEHYEDDCRRLVASVNAQLALPLDMVEDLANSAEGRAAQLLAAIRGEVTVADDDGEEQ